MQPAAPAEPRVLRFGTFELHESTGELMRNGSLVHLPPQPFQILRLLVRNAGDVVERGRIRHEVWGGTTVDFDRSLNVAIAQIRAALNDTAESPRFIQTLPRKGYRFLAAVDHGIEVKPAAEKPRIKRPHMALVITCGILVLTLAVAAAVFRPWPSSDKPVRIAVLPFDHLALNDTETAKSDGLFDDLLTRLGGVQPSRIQVIGRRSVQYLNAKGTGSLREIGKRLNVSYVVESSVREEGGGLRVAVRLVDTGNESVRWSGTFTETSQYADTIVARVSAAVLTSLFPGATGPASEAGCRSGQEALQTGRMLLNRGGMKDLERSLAFFENAACAPARAQLAESLVRLARMGAEGEWEKARGAARTALDSDAHMEAAHLAMGNIAFWHDWKWQAARREFDEALRISPSNPDAHHDMAWLQIALGMRAEALGSIETAIAIDPLSARTRMDSAWLLLQIGRFEQAAAEARKALELAPEMMEARACLSRALLYAGDVRGAIGALGQKIPAAIATELADLPDEKAARRFMEFALQQDAVHGAYQRACRLAWLGSRGEALTALEEAFRSHSLMMPMVAVDPAFVTIRNEPGFRRIVQDLGLTQ